MINVSFAIDKVMIARLGLCKKLPKRAVCCDFFIISQPICDFSDEDNQ